MKKERVDEPVVADTFGLNSKASSILRARGRSVQPHLKKKSEESSKKSETLLQSSMKSSTLNILPPLPSIERVGGPNLQTRRKKV